MIPGHINSLQWQNAVGIARQSCARFFRDGALPHDAVRAFGIDPAGLPPADWAKAVDAIAQALCVQPERKAA